MSNSNQLKVSQHQYNHLSHMDAKPKNRSPEFPSKYMLSNSSGCYTGYACKFIFNEDHKIFHCPTIFHTVKEANLFIKMREA